ncbi:MAG: helicase, partial [Candidatus Paceibacterota bacterium]
MSDQPVLTKPPSSAEIRAELEAMVVGDLLGPAGGESEELTERTVRDRYIVGVLAPSRAGAPSDTAADEEDEETPLIPDELAEGGTDTIDDGTTDKDVPVAAGHLPSSIGMTFCVDGDVQSIKVSVSWGQYKREVREDQISERTGNPIRVWQRYSRGGVVDVPLKVGPVKATAPDNEFSDIYVQGQVRKRDSYWVVTLFLINAQEEGRPKDEFQVFQPVLRVEAADKSAIFCKRMTVGSNHDLEENLMAMLYRHQVEFAVGHGVSVHAEVSKESSDRAKLIRTEFIPRHEVPRTAPPTENDADQNPAFEKLKGLALDMKALAEAD